MSTDSEMRAALRDAEREGQVDFETTMNAIDATPVPNEYDLTGELPCGLKDENGTVYKDYEIIESTGAVEEAVAGVIKKSGGAKVINKLLELCLLKVGPYVKSEMKPRDWVDKVINRLTVPDQDFLAFKIRKNSNDEELESNHKCPNCGAKIKYYFEIDELEFKPYSGDDSQEIVVELPIGVTDKDGNVHREVRMRLTNGLDREIALPTARVNVKKATTLILARICTFTDGYPLTEITLRSMKTRDRKFLEEKSRNLLDFGYQTEVEVECNACGTTFEAQLSALENFL